jgi:hypothetical protein
MDTYLFTILLILIDIQPKHRILISALIQFIFFSLFHANYYFVSCLLFMANALNSLTKIILILFLTYYYDLNIIYSILEIYLNILLLTITLSIPTFFVYILYNQTLALASNKNFLEKISKPISLCLKGLILVFSFYDCNLSKVFFFSIWILSILFLKHENTSQIRDKHRKQINSITEQELDKLHKIYESSEREKFNLLPTTEKL